MSTQVIIKNALGVPIWYATVHKNSIKFDFESYGIGPGEPDIESHESVPSSEFMKIRKQYGYHSNFPMEKLLQELSETSRGEEFKVWARSNLRLKSDFVWWSFDD